MMKIKVPDDLIPEGAELIEAYLTGKGEIVAIGEPDWQQDHNCDSMGCTIFSHVIYRATPGDLVKHSCKLLYMSPEQLKGGN